MICLSLDTCFSVHFFSSPSLVQWLKRIKRICFFYIRRKLIPSFSATIRYRFLSFASCHSGDVKIVCCISQVNINTSVSILCEQIRRKLGVRPVIALYVIVALSFLIIGDGKPFKVLDQRVADVS